jgi:hypothetical protein
MGRAFHPFFSSRLRTGLFWLLLLSIPVGGLAIGLAFVAYWTVPPISIRVSGDPLISYDAEIGFVPRHMGSSFRTDLVAGGTQALHFHVYTDARGARVSHAGENSPERPDILFVGDSFAWGHGVENEDTFAVKTAAALGLTEANLSFGSYGTTQAVQLLRHNRALRPRIVVYPFIMDHPRRNVALCAPSYYPFCLDYSHVAFDADGNPFIAPPISNGVRRTLVQVEAQTAGIDPVTWVLHGFDVIYGRVLIGLSDARERDPERQEKALAYLIGLMAGEAKSLDAELVIIYIPYRAIAPAPKLLSELARPLGYRFIDLTQAFATADGKALYLPDGHPNADGHALIARELATFIHQGEARN